MSGTAAFGRQLFDQVTRAAQTATTAASRPPAAVRRWNRYVPGEQVLVNGKRLSKPLRPGEASPVPGSNHKLQHDAVLGRPIGQLRIDGPDGRYIKVEQPTLNEYISLTRRNVTPVYPTYASTIVSLLDIQTCPPPLRDLSFTAEGQEAEDHPRIDILEAGTGHGSLTIHLARAIAAANRPPPLTALPSGRQTHPDNATTDPDWSSWLQNRSAIIHTVESVARNSHDAEKLIRGFRQGLYWPHIDFYTSGVDTWLQDRIQALTTASEPTGFLSHVLLDLPEVHSILPLAAQAMRNDGLLAVFCPSVTQIAECQKLIKQQKLPLSHENVVELGDGISSGRIWDVRVVVPRSVTRAAAASAVAQKNEEGNEGDLSDTETLVAKDDGGDNVASDAIPQEDPAASIDQPVQDMKFVCRPKVGELTFGGGFVGLWRKSSF